MTIPAVLERNETGLSTLLRPRRPSTNVPGLGTPIAEEDSPIRAQVANRTTFDIEPYREVENNEDQKTPGYPDGPICIYPDNVFLYLEPTAEEASRFDVVINVAREVQNPFKPSAAAQNPEETGKGSAENSPIPDTAVTAASFETAFEFMPEESTADTPTTPRAQTIHEPEYIHMPWDHNTDIAHDLLTLCELIDKRVQDGKKVLVHCQQGASRSASLIIAYGIYRNPELSVNDAYYAAQARSRWISPNMRLMYCLQDFQKEISKRKAPTSGLKPRSGRSPTKHRMTLSADHIELPPKEPLTAPLPGSDPADQVGSPDKCSARARGTSTPGRGDPISPGPSSAPSSFSWAEKEDENDPGKFGRFNLDLMLKPPQLDPRVASVSAFSKPPPSPGFAPLSICQFPPSPGPAPLSLSLPPMSPGFPPPDPFSKPPPSPGFGTHRFRSSPGSFGFTPLSLCAPPKQTEKKEVMPERQASTTEADFSDDVVLMSPRAETMTNNPLHDPFAGLAGMQFIEVPPTPQEGLFSPRQSLYPRDPLFPFGRPPQIADPRSPPTKGETPIVRSIDEMI